MVELHWEGSAAAACAAGCFYYKSTLCGSLGSENFGPIVDIPGANSLAKGHQDLSVVRSKVVLFMFRKIFLEIFFTSDFLFGANFENLFWIY